jgi:prenylcysteine alpha-carboxyl methylesterase
VQALRLLLYSLLLLPGFSQMLLFYFFSPRVIRSVPYGPKPRQRADVYLPRAKWMKKVRDTFVKQICGI